MKIPFLGTVVDERFLMYRLRSSSYAGMAGAVVLGGIFEYRIFVNHHISWDLLGVLGAMVIVKLSLYGVVSDPRLAATLNSKREKHT